VMGMLLGTSASRTSISLMLCTLHAWRQGRRTCGKADGCSVHMYHVREEV
jgi:hypothetical protein